MLITIATFLEPAEAHIVRARLEAEGIPAVVASDGIASLDWAYSQAIGGVAVQVPASDRDAALEMLRAYEAGEFARDVDAEVGTTDAVCPGCGTPPAETAMRVPLTQKLLAVGVLLVAGGLFPTRRSAVTCAACGRQWDRDD
jgi:hypothetical protein